MNQLNYTTDQHLIIKIQNDEETAFQELFVRYSSRIYKFSLAYLKNKSDAEGMVQNVFLILWEKRNSINTSKNIQGFIFTITVNAIYDSLRRKKTEFAFLKYTHLNNTINKNITWDSILHKEMKRNISYLMNQLPDQQKRIYKLSKIKGYKNDEISFMMGLSKRTVENHLYRAGLFIKKNFPD